MDNGAGSYRRFLDGDDSGIVEIIRDYKDGLLFYLNGIVGSFHVAEDLAEDTFVRLAIKKPKFHGDSSFKTWLYTVGRHLAMDYLRKNKRSEQMQTEAEPEDRESECLEQSYLRDERKRILHRAMKRLSPDYRQVLWLVYFEDFDNSQAADTMKKSKRQIENLLYRAKLSLKAELEKEGITSENL